MGGNWGSFNLRRIEVNRKRNKVGLSVMEKNKTDTNKLPE